MDRIVFIQFSVLLLTSAYFEKDSLILHTLSGQLRGIRITAFPSNQSTLAFLGIPYAENTEGQNRFRPPKAILRWAGVFNATQYGVACIADPPLTYKNEAGGPIGEDCLKINVFTNEFCIATKSCSVLAVVHGGKFNFESPVIFRPETIANNFVAQERNIVVVTIPFRLGALGWFNLSPWQHSTAVKNIALHDILFGLEWIQREISVFGGDRTRVTLMGHSSGATVVDIISLSPRSKDLFSQVIQMSGVDALYGAETSKTQNERASLAVAEIVGCYDTKWKTKKVLGYKTVTHVPSQIVEQVIECMRNVSAETILNAQLSLYERPEDFFGPCVDGPGGILPLPTGRLQRPKRRTLIGTLTAESKGTLYIENADGSADEAKLRETCLHFGYETSFENPERFARKCAQFYSGMKRARNFMDDYLFYAPTADAADRLTENGAEVFVYSYSYNGAGAAYKNWTDVPLFRRPSHSEDYIYIMGLHRGPFTQKDYDNERVYSGMLANFINGLKPHPKWKSWSREEREYFEINFDHDMDAYGAQNGYYLNTSIFWSERNAGKYVKIPSYPPDFDTVNGENLFTALDSHHSGVSTAHDKTFVAEETVYWEWSSWLAQHRRIVLLSLDATQIPLRNETGPVEDGGFTFWTLLLYIGMAAMVGLLAGLVYTGIKKCVEIRRRYEYYELLN